MARLLATAALGVVGGVAVAEPETTEQVFREILSTLQAGDAIIEGAAVGTVSQLPPGWMWAVVLLWAVMLVRPIALKLLDMRAEAERHKHDLERLDAERKRHE